MSESVLVSKAIVIKYNSGIKPDGKYITKSQKINKLRLNISDDDCFAVGVAIMSLMGEKAIELGKSLDYVLSES